MIMFVIDAISIGALHHIWSPTQTWSYPTSEILAKTAYAYVIQLWEQLKPLGAGQNSKGAPATT